MSFPLPEPMRLALDEARAAAAAGEVPVGAVVVRDNAIVAIGRNRMRDDHDPDRPCRDGGAACGGRSARHVTPRRLRPVGDAGALRDVRGAIALARIDRLYFGAADPKGGAVLHGPRLFAQPTCHHAPEVYSGIGEGEAGEMLRAFFRDRRPAGDRTPGGGK